MGATGKAHCVEIVVTLLRFFLELIFEGFASFFLKGTESTSTGENKSSHRITYLILFGMLTRPEETNTMFYIAPSCKSKHNGSFYALGFGYIYIKKTFFLFKESSVQRFL